VAVLPPAADVVSISAGNARVTDLDVTPGGEPAAGGNRVDGHDRPVLVGDRDRNAGADGGSDRPGVAAADDR